MRNRKGFTLLELIIVIIVIGILASIALPRYIRVTEKARTAEAKSGLSTLRSAQLRYAAQYGNYSADMNATDAELTAGKYFSFTTNAAEPIAEAARNTVDLPSGIGGQYTIAIDSDGILNITPGFNFLM